MTQPLGAEVTITDLPPGTAPLAGTEPFETIQSGASAYLTAFQLWTYPRLQASTTTYAALNIPVGNVPASPIDGDIWRQDDTLTGLKIYIAGAVHTISVT
jgi:hypothetical protein